MKKRYHHIFYFIVVAVFGFTLAALYKLTNIGEKIRSFISDPHLVKIYASKLGIFAPIILVLLTTSAVVVTPLPFTLLTVTSGYLYGIFFGFLIIFAGKIIGTFIAFNLARKYGRPFVETIIEEHELKHFEVFFEKRGLTALFVSYLLPIFPNDSISYLSGLTKIKYSRFLLLSSIGFIPNIFFTILLGDRLFKYGLSIKVLLPTIIVLVIALIYTFREQLKVIFIKEIKELEAEAKILEKKAIKEEKRIVKDLKKGEKEVEKELIEIDKGFLEVKE